MSQEANNQVLDNQSNLLQSTNDLNDQPKPQPASGTTHDQVPIGGGKKFQFTEFPQEGEAPKKPLKKPPARFAKKLEQDAKKQQQSESATTSQTGPATSIQQPKAKPAVVSPDDIPLGGKKFQFSQFPQQGQQPKKVVKKPPARLAERMKKTENKQQQPATQENQAKQTTSAKNIDDIPIGGGSNKNNFDQQPIGGSKKNNFDEQPIGGSKKNTFDDQPIGGGNKNGFDQQPIGGGKKFQMSQFPQEGQAPKPPPKKATKKVAKAPAKVEVNAQEAPLNRAPLDEVPVGGGGKTGVFDEVPIGKAANNFMMSEFPDGDEQQPAIQTNYTMSQKLKSKAVKLKLSGMQDLQNLLQNNPNSQELGQISMGSLLKQTNPACLQKILQCLKVWVQKQKKWGDDEVKTAIQNGYINGKPNTKKLTVQIIDIMYEKSPDVIQMALLVGLKGKVPKTLAGYIAFINELLTIYGMKRMKYLKPYFPDIVTILNREKLVAVKTEGINLLKQAYKWLTKEVVEPLIKDLKENLKKQLDTFWQTYDKNLVMSAPKDIPESNDGKPKKKVDAYQLSEAVDVFKKYNEKFSQQVINEQKWSEKVRMMTQFVNAANVPKLAHNSDYRHITQMIRRLINHSNFNVVLWDLKILAVLSKGLRRHFAPTVKAQFSNVIGKFRDKKTQMVDQTFNTLNQFSYCISIEDVLDDIKQGLGDKTPNMKVNLLNWIGKFVEKKVQQKDDVPQKAKQAIRNLFPIFEKLLADGVAQVRDAMVKNLGKMKILMGDDFFAPMDKKMSKGQASKLDQVKKQLPPKKVSKQKDKKQTGNAPSSKPPKDSGLKGTSKTIQNNSMVSNQGKGDISQQIMDLIPKMNHSDWQKRKQSAQAIIGIISNNMQAKITSTVLFDFLNTLKTRIADPNKNIVKYFVQLTGLIFEMMGDRDVKNNAKNFICALADGLSDKVQANRKQIAAIINKIGGIFGREQLLTILGSYLDTDKQSRIEIINIILENADYLQKADTKQYPKGIIRGLVDKNKQIRNLAERLLERIHQKTGLETFKNLARNQRPAIAKDLNTLLTKYEGTKVNTSTIPKGLSPPKGSKQPPQPPISGKKPSQRSDSKNSKIHQQSFDKDAESEETIPNHKQLYSTLQPGAMILKQGKTSLVEGNEQFAPLKILSNERVQRQQNDERYPWMCDTMLESQQDQLRESLQMLFKQELAKKMLSIDYRKVIQAASQIIKLCKDIAHHNEIRQVYDIIFKWVFVRLWGGNPSINMILQVLPHVMSILEKKKLVINDGQVDIIVAILRESFITGYMNQYKVSESLYSITKLLIALSSGDRLLKKFLRQFSVELTSVHRHVRKQATEFYRVGLSKLIKNELMDYVGNGSSLEEASRIKQLKNDSQFVQLLYKRFHENVLDSFGFRNNVAPTQPSPQVYQQPANVQRQSPIPQKKVVEQVYQQKPRSQIQPPAVIQGKRTPTQSIEGRPTIVRQQEPARQTFKSQQAQNKQVPQIKQQFDEELDLRVYTMPPPGNPLGRQLAKLINPNEVADTTVAFFTNMFAETNEKISAELTTYANIIFGAILKSVKHMIEHRNEHMPQKIVNHINLLQQAIRCKFIINHIDQQLLYHGTRFALYQLVYEDEHKNMIAQDLINKGIDFKPDQFVKVINGIMLRILQNACPQEIVNILLNLLNKQLQMPQVSQKTISLVSKCLSRVSSNYALDINPQRTKQFILRVVEYFNIMNLQVSLQQFNPHPDERLRPQDNNIKTLKQILNELIRNYSEELWIHYENAMSQSRCTDNHVSQYIQFMGVAYPENIEKLAQEDENLKKINDLLSKTKTFDTGVAELRKYMSSNPEFIPVQYFISRGYEQKFIVMVMNALETTRPRRTPTKREIRQQRSQNSRTVTEIPASQTTIQDKIQKLRARFDQVPQNKPQEKPAPPPATLTAGKKEEQRGQQRAQEIKRRIDQMRNRLNRN